MTTLIAKTSLETYFDREIRSETRQEYLDGDIITMTGGTPNHNTLVSNLLFLLYSALQAHPYRVFVTDQRLWIPDRRIATYPDIAIVREPVSLMDGRKDTIVNPILIAEVLSESTEAYDRGDKFAAYRTIPTFCEYLLISQTSMTVERFHKDGDRWIFTDYVGEAAIAISSLGIAIAIATTDLYRRVDFPQEASSLP